MKFIIGKKLNMTQIWQQEKKIAVTRVLAGPCVVVQKKESDGPDKYNAVQLGFGEKKEKNIRKPQKGHLKKTGVNSRHLREFRCTQDELGKLKVGDSIGAEIFEVGDKVKASADSKGRGFQGVVKRHGFSGMPKSHGTKDQLRMPGSVGATGPAHVFKGQRMPGRMGGSQVTTANLKIVDIDKENNILLIEGSIPGAANGLVLIQGKGELKLAAKEENPAEEKEEEKDKTQEAEVEEKAEPEEESPEDKDKE